MPELWALAARVSCGFFGQRHLLSLKVGQKHKGMVLGVRTGEVHIIGWAGTGDECLRRFQELYHRRGSAPTTECLILDAAGHIVENFDASISQDKFPVSVRFISLHMPAMGRSTYQNGLSHLSESVAEYLDLGDWHTDSLMIQW